MTHDEQYTPNGLDTSWADNWTQPEKSWKKVSYKSAERTRIVQRKTAITENLDSLFYTIETRVRRIRDIDARRLVAAKLVRFVMYGVLIRLEGYRTSKGFDHHFKQIVINEACDDKSDLHMEMIRNKRLTPLIHKDPRIRVWLDDILDEMFTSYFLDVTYM